MTGEGSSGPRSYPFLLSDSSMAENAVRFSLRPGFVGVANFLFNFDITQRRFR